MSGPHDTNRCSGCGQTDPYPHARDCRFGEPTGNRLEPAEQNAQLRDGIQCTGADCGSWAVRWDQEQGPLCLECLEMYWEVRCETINLERRALVAVLREGLDAVKTYFKTTWKVDRDAPMPPEGMVAWERLVAARDRAEKLLERRRRR